MYRFLPKNLFLQLYGQKSVRIGCDEMFRAIVGKCNATNLLILSVLCQLLRYQTKRIVFQPLSLMTEKRNETRTATKQNNILWHFFPAANMAVNQLKVASRLVSKAKATKLR